MVSTRKITNLCTLLFFIYSSTAICSEKYQFSAGLIKLIISPEDYENKVVQVSGYLSDIPPIIYLSKQHAELGSSGDSISVIDSTESGELVDSGCLGKFVNLTGTVKKGRSNTPRFHITDILSVKIIENGQTQFCYKTNQEKLIRDRHLLRETN